ncbi:hypothetical protein [Coxiella endosymbiont of Amblyomma americanum]|uniref:hypothetical protein n=1 Tax=Coxiella endosymbiont of Amblyomma americanum TaxID=325775 RepID=UPI000581EB5A|nr:hypothetical protein [Coxiella endosymbiont of Amblyomma americanum]AJC50353.1 Hpr(Ser) kinase/phosphatase [Coxiella endosymbiont of Amblyomma americanum]AUJ58699.1 hypothetical protein B1F76_01175 [Coxiella-like endosymbiont of Amblyomma americanum]
MKKDIAGHIDHITLHANFLVIKKLGVLIMGDHAIGKSELTLSLLDRGHQMVCDDAVDISRQNNQLIGSCPSVTYGHVLIAGIGIIDIPSLFGLSAVVSQHKINLIITLTGCKEKYTITDPLNPISLKEKILGITIPKIIFPIHSRRNVPLLIETLIHNQGLKKFNC